MASSSQTLTSLTGDILYFSVVRFVDRDSRCTGCLLTMKCSWGKQLWKATKIFVLLILLHGAMNYLLGLHLLVYLVSVSMVVTSFTILLFSVYKESVVVLGSLGLHTSTTYWCGYTSTLFIPHTVIGDIIINEAITMHRVIFYLAALIGEGKGSSCSATRLIPLFTEFSPRLETIETVYHEIRDVLYSDTIT